MRKRKELYLGLIAVLYHQLGEVPPDFFVDIVSQDNFLTSTLQVEDTSGYDNLTLNTMILIFQAK